MAGRSVTAAGLGAASANATDTSRVPAASGRRNVIPPSAVIRYSCSRCPAMSSSRGAISERDRARGTSPDLVALDERTVHAHLDLVGALSDPFYHLARAVALHPDREDVLPVERKVMAHRETAVGGERHAFVETDVAALEPGAVHLHDRPVVGTADGGAADLGRRRDVAGHQRRGDGQHLGVVVEAEAGHVAWQQRLAVDLQPQQILDGVHVLHAVQAARHHPSRVGIGGGHPIEGGLERGREGIDGRRRRSRPSLGRHLPGPQLAHDLLEHLRVAGTSPTSSRSSMRPAVCSRSL